MCNAMLAVPIALPLRGINRGLHSRVTNRIRAAALEVQFGRMTMFKVPRGRKFGSSRLPVLYLSAENSGLIVLVCSLHFENLEKNRSVCPSVARHAIYYVSINTRICPSKRSDKSSIHSSNSFFSFHNSKLTILYEKFVYLLNTF